ncbi:MAG: hypothetical protein JOZ99_03085 [Actinobacteria bacterium]|nr:hypothetical protein [Actinomycetota bacterium]
MRRLVSLSVLVAVFLAVGASCSSGTGKGAQTKRTTTTTTTSSAGSSAPTTVPATSGGGTAATTSNDPNHPCGRASAAPARYRHVIWLWMENHTWSSVIGTGSAPYLTSLVNACGSLRAESVVGSPSLPNYLGATAGQTFGIGDDNDPSSHRLTADNLFRQVRTAGGTSKSYEESMPSNCKLASSGEYAVRHNPAAYYTGADDRAACTRDDIPLGTPSNGALADALSTDTLPTFAFITPNVCDDTHDCSVATGDAWLKSWVPEILTSAAYQRGDTALIIDYDEYSPVPNAWMAPSIRPGASFTQKTDHNALLRATEEMLGLPLLGSAGHAPDVRTALNV